MDTFLGVVGATLFFVSASGMDSEGNPTPLIIMMMVGLLMVGVSDYIKKRR